MYDAIFISYRREGSSTFAGVLYDALCRSFPASGVFRDKNKLLPGKDFRVGIDQAIDKAATMLVLINRGWPKIADEEGNIKLFKENDFIRYEIKSALAKSKNIIPVLFEGGEMPEEKELPEDIRGLCNYQAFEIDEENITKSVNTLLDLIRSLSTDKLGNTVTESFIRLKKNPKGTMKAVSDTVINLAKRETNLVTSYLKKFLKKKEKE